MKLSTKARYGLRAMLDLAEHSKDGPVQARVIAERQEISSKYLEHLLAALKAQALVRVSRGAHGGYELSRPAQEITLGDVVRALEGSLDLVECVDSPQECPRSGSCVTRDVWRELKDVMTNVLDGTTLRDLVTRHEAKRHQVGTGATYDI